MKKSYFYTPGGQILAQYDCNGYDKAPNSVIIDGAYFYLHDRSGSVRLVINQDGDVNNSYTYNPFGEMFPSECNETVYNPFKFSGQFFDDEIGQYYLRARMYAPNIGRFTSRDPAFGKFKEPMTLHEYLYCNNDPINKVDPNGEFAWVAARLLIGAAVGTISSGMASDWDAKAMIVGGVAGMLSGVVPGKMLGIVAGAFLGGTSNAYAEYKQHGSWQAAVMGFSSGFGGGMVTGGLMGGLGLLPNSGLMTFMSSQLFGLGASTYLGAPNDRAAEIIEYMEEHRQRMDGLPN